MKLARQLLVPALVALTAAFAASPAAAGSKSLPALTPVPSDSLSRALTTGQLTDAQYALERARSLFAPRGVRARFGNVLPVRPDAATLVLRDLAARQDELGPSEREQARRILARPSNPNDALGDGWTAPKSDRRELCTGRFCIHWVVSTSDRPSLIDDNGNGTPDWIDATRRILGWVLTKEVDQIGFPEPENDASSGSHNGGNPDGTIDVYLADVGADGLYGYCTSDDPRSGPTSEYKFYDVSAFCVLDNDFSPLQFPGVTGLDANRVTIAHEIHHAEQFALDWLEDAWIMEADATFMEHAVYPAIHDNYQYLSTSPISQPGVPLDLSDPSAFSVYGDWIFFKWVAQHVGGPKVMRRIWGRLDGSPGGPDQYSVQGVASVLRAQKHPLPTLFTRFALANRHPRRSYWLKGLPGVYARLASNDPVGRNHPRRVGSWKSRHLAARWVGFRRGSSAPRRARLRIQVDLPYAYTGPQARAVVVYRNGKRWTRTIHLDRKGDGRVTLPFGPATRRVELLLVNTSRRLICWYGGRYSCSGKPLDDGKRYSFVATLR